MLVSKHARWFARVNVVLIVGLVGLVAILAAFAVRGTTVLPGRTPAESRADEYAAVSRAARVATLSFLEVDHTRMDRLTARVLEGATGEFARQYEASIPSLVASAEKEQTIAHGQVLQVGLRELRATRARVLVAADSQVRTTGAEQRRQWRIELTLTKKSGRWLVSGLRFVG